VKNKSGELTCVNDRAAVALLDNSARVKESGMSEGDICISISSSDLRNLQCTYDEKLDRIYTL